MVMEEKICPYCYGSIKDNYGTEDSDYICPHPNCRKIVPKMYLQYPTKHVASIVSDITCNFNDFGYEIASFAECGYTEEETACLVQHYGSENDDLQFIQYEYVKEEFSSYKETVVLAIHRCVWNSDVGRPISDIRHASAILLNIDISELRTLYFNIDKERSREDFKNWHPKNIENFIRDVSCFLRDNNLNKKTAILFGNPQYLRSHPYISEDNRYLGLWEINRDWDSNFNERKWVSEANITIRDLLMELGEDRLVCDADTMPNVKFFLYPSSKYRMASNTFWMMAVLLWICTKVD